MLCFALLYIFLGGAVVLINFLWHSRFRKFLRRESPAGFETARPPRALVVLTLRGADPFLERTLQRLAEQSYSNFALRIIIDSADDPAWGPVKSFLRLENRPETDVQILNRRLGTCSLKSSALLQAMSELEPEYDAVAQIDADAVPYSDWLKDMLAPLANPRIGAVSGLRWYVPEPSNWATLHRQIWGTGAMVQMYACHLPWGGSMAMSREFLEQSDLFERWSKCLSEDMAVTAALRTVNMELDFAPAVLTNHERTELPQCFEFIRRQLFQVRWHHEQWKVVARTSWLLLISVSLGLVLIAMNAAQGAWAWAIALALLLQVYTFLYGKAQTTTEHLIRERLQKQGEAAAPVGFWYHVGVPGTGLLFGACFLSVNLIRRITWRGVEYEALGVNQFRMLVDEEIAVPVHAELAKSQVAS